MSFGYDDESLKHDAYAAHALVMAMSESANLDSDSMWEDERERVFRRANEILETWGYEE
jgi:hypothetical protein